MLSPQFRRSHRFSFIGPRRKISAVACSKKNRRSANAYQRFFGFYTKAFQLNAVIG